MADSPLAAIEPRLRHILPARLYATVWVEPDIRNLMRVFTHLRTFQHILHDYVPRRVLESPPVPGEVRHHWEEGTLMFTDLAGFTALLEANVSRGQAATLAILDLLNHYFSTMIEVISKSGGNLLEFTGDALLAFFPRSQRTNDAAQAIRAGLRMQRAMQQFAEIEMEAGTFSLKMRVGLHTGRFVMADIGTPRRMEHVLLGKEVHQAKLAESAGRVDRVNLTQATHERVGDAFRFEPGQDGCLLVVDDLSAESLGEYEIIAFRRRLSSPLMLDRSIEGLVNTIAESLDVIEPLACFLPSQVRHLLVENATMRRIPPECPRPVVMFVSLLGLPEAVDEAPPDEVKAIVNSFSRIFALINAAVEARDGVLKKVTYHLSGSDIVIYFGVPGAHTDDALRAASAALAILDIVRSAPRPRVAGRELVVRCKIGINQGFAFVGEIGEARGRREYNVLGDTVNTAARLMNRAAENEILLGSSVQATIIPHFETRFIESVSLKGKRKPTEIYRLLKEIPTTETMRRRLQRDR